MERIQMPGYMGGTGKSAIPSLASRDIRRHVWIGRLRLPLPLSLAVRVEAISTRIGERRYELAMGTPREREIFLSSFDKFGRYRHWSGFWESQTGWIFDSDDGRWYALEDEDQDD